MVFNFKDTFHDTRTAMTLGVEIFGLLVKPDLPHFDVCISHVKHFDEPSLPIAFVISPINQSMNETNNFCSYVYAYWV